LNNAGFAVSSWEERASIPGFKPISPQELERDWNLFTEAVFRKDILIRSPLTADNTCLHFSDGSYLNHTRYGYLRISMSFYNHLVSANTNLCDVKLEFSNYGKDFYELIHKIYTGTFEGEQGSPDELLQFSNLFSFQDIGRCERTPYKQGVTLLCSF